MIGTATELERIGDYAEGIARLVLRSAHLAPAEPPPQLPSMAAIAQHMLREAMEAFVLRDAQAGPRFQIADNEIDDLYSDLSAWVLARMRERPPAIERLIAYLQTAHNFERIADRTVNIAERTTFIATGVLDAKSNRGIGNQESGIGG
jgi:phosphate transport system protein